MLSAPKFVSHILPSASSIPHGVVASKDFGYQLVLFGFKNHRNDFIGVHLAFDPAGGDFFTVSVVPGAIASLLSSDEVILPTEAFVKLHDGSEYPKKLSKVLTFGYLKPTVFAVPKGFTHDVFQVCLAPYTQVSHITHIPSMELDARYRHPCLILSRGTQAFGDEEASRQEGAAATAASATHPTAAALEPEENVLCVGLSSSSVVDDSDGGYSREALKSYGYLLLPPQFFTVGTEPCARPQLVRTDNVCIKPRSATLVPYKAKEDSPHPRLPEAIGYLMASPRSETDAQQMLKKLIPSIVSGLPKPYDQKQWVSALEAMWPQLEVSAPDTLQAVVPILHQMMLARHGFKADSDGDYDDDDDHATAEELGCTDGLSPALPVFSGCTEGFGLAPLSDPCTDGFPTTQNVGHSDGW